MPADKQRRRNSYGYLQDKAREASELFTQNAKGIRVDLRLYVYPREHANQVVVRSASGTNHVEIRIDRPMEAPVALAAIWEEAVKLAKRNAASSAASGDELPIETA